MTLKIRTAAFYVGALALALALIEIAWMRMGSFFALAAATLAGAWLVARASGPASMASPPAPAVAAQAAPSEAAPRWAGPGLGLSLLGCLLLAVAHQLLLQGRQALGLAGIVMAALCWRPLLPLRPEAGLSRRWIGGLMLAIMVVGTLFRFYQAGEVPAGMITVDEPRLMVWGQEIMEGKRVTFRLEGSEGNAPFWVNGAALWLFGNDITGFRMSALLPGLILVGLMGLLVLELAGPRMGLLCAALTAVSVWPVTFSRSEYLIGSSLVPMVAAPWLFARGLRTGSPLAHALAGVCLGLCFNIYNPARLVPLLVLLLGAFLWLQRQELGSALRRSILPLVGGLVVGLGPLLLWAADDPAFASKAYFGKLDWDLIAGQGVAQTQGFASKLDTVLGRVLPNLPRVLTMFTTDGGMRPWFFKMGQAVIDPLTLYLVLAGLAASLVRFRQAVFPFMVSWWLLGLTPTLLADPAYHMDERRIMLAMPATLFLAAAGCFSLAQLFTRHLRRAAADKALLASGLALFAVLAVQNWRSYFHDIQRDRHLQDENHANFDIMLRGIFRQHKQAPVQVLSFRKPNQDNWWGSNPQNTLEEHWEVLHRIPRTVASTNTDYFLGNGMFGLLEAMAPAKGDPLIVLTPFHFYLEPLLLSLGGERVEDLPPIQAKDGVNLRDTGMAHDIHSATRMIRLRHWDPERLLPLKDRLFTYTVEELTAPADLGRWDELRDAFIVTPEHMRLLERYEQAPGTWRAGQPTSFAMADPWFWVTANHFPGQPSMPLRLRARWTLNIPAAGRYAFGASASVYTALRINKQKVFSYIPRSQTHHEGARNGYLGEAVQLEAGPHAFELEQVALNNNGNFNHLIRVMWQAPGREPETLPIELLSDPR